MQTDDAKTNDSDPKPEGVEPPTETPPEKTAPAVETGSNDESPEVAKPLDAETDAKSEAAPAVEEKPALVVAVSTDAEFTQKLRAHFEGKGFRVETFGSKAELGEWPWDQDPVLFVVAQNLGGEDGRGIVLDARDQGRLAGCPIVLLTDASMDKATREFTLKLGIRKIVQAPVEMEPLERIIADEPRVKGEKGKSGRFDAGEKKADDNKAFAERKAAVLKKMGQDETEGASTGAPAEEKRSAPATTRVAPTTARVAPTTARVGTASAASKTTVVTGTPGSAGVAAVHAAQEQHALWVKGVCLGILFPSLLVLVRALVIPWGYTSPVVIVEGAVLGLLAGMGLAMSMKKLNPPPEPGPIVLGVLGVTAVVWVLSIVLRLVVGVGFVERTAAAKAHLNDPGREWGLSEYVAIAYNLAMGILAYAAAMAVVRFALFKPPQGQAGKPQRSGRE